MKRILFSAGLVLIMGHVASANVPELFIKTGGTTITVVGAGNSVSYSNANFGGWNIKTLFGDSSSPGLEPYGLDETSLTATCVGGGTCADLHVWLSDTDFNEVVTGFATSYSGTVTGAGQTTQKAWVGLGNTFFQGDGSDGSPTVSGGSLIGSLGPFSAPTAAGFATGGPAAGPSNYSLTIEQIFKGCTGVNCASYSVDGNITGVPEPASVVLFGTILAFCASRLRRRKVA
jgi:hypothetical protein